MVRRHGWLNQGDSVQENYVGEIVVGRRVVIPGIEYSLEGMKQGAKKNSKNQSSPCVQGDSGKGPHPCKCGAHKRNRGA